MPLALAVAFFVGQSSEPASSGPASTPVASYDELDVEIAVFVALAHQEQAIRTGQAWAVGGLGVGLAVSGVPMFAGGLAGQIIGGALIGGGVLGLAVGLPVALTSRGIAEKVRDELLLAPRATPQERAKARELLWNRALSEVSAARTRAIFLGVMSSALVVAGGVLGAVLITGHFNGISNGVVQRDSLSLGLMIGSIDVGLSVGLLVQVIQVFATMPGKYESAYELRAASRPRTAQLRFDGINFVTDGRRTYASVGLAF